MPGRIAIGALAALLSLGAVSDEDAFGRALTLAAEKRYAEAREVLDAVLEREPGHVQGRLLHGVLHARDGRLGEAIEVFEALRREHPGMAEPYNNLAVLYALEGRLEDARATLLAILERRPDPVGYANLGDVYTRLARRAYERAQELDSGSGRDGAGEVGATFAMPASSQASPEAVPEGDGPGPETPAVESGAAVADPAGADPEVAEPAAGAPDAASKSRDVAGAGPSPAASGVGDMAATQTVSAGSGVGDLAATQTVPAGSEGSMPSAFCARAGGFEGRRAVAEAALWLQSQGAEVLEVRFEERHVSGPWRVYLPSFASRAEAEAKLREIHSRGVRDVAVIRDGDLANGVSFGVYRKAANMHRRMAAIGRLGYAVQSQAAGVKPVEGYELEARTRGAAAAFAAAWASRFPERPLQAVDCG